MKLWPETCLRLLAASLLAALVAMGFGIYHYQNFMRRLSAWQKGEAEAKSHEGLETLVTLPGGKLKLGEFGALITKVSGLPVALDEPTIAAETRVWDPAAIVVRVPKGTQALRSALWIALEPLELAADLRGGTIHITTIDASIDRNRLFTVVYPLPQPEPARMDEDAWCWTIIGYAVSKAGRVVTVPGALVVVATADGHRRIRDAMAAIRNLESDPRPQIPLSVPSQSDVQRRIYAALDEPADFDFENEPLNDAIGKLSDHYQIPMLVDGRRLADAGVSPKTPVLKLITGVSLRTALSLLLRDLDLAFAIKGDALWITTPDESEEQLQYMAYPVHDLVESLDGRGHAALLKIITSTIAPQSWDDVGGPGSISRAGEGWLLTSQTSEVHKQVAELLGSLREALASERPLGQFWPTPTRFEAKIRTALARRLPLEFDNTPLIDAIAALHQTADIPIVLNVKTLRDSGVDPQMPVSCRLPPGPLALQLQMLLAPLDLTYIVRDDVIQVTTPDDANCQLVTRIFNVRSLLGARRSPKSLEALVQLIEPQSWDIVGGPGGIQHFRGLLLVSQTADVLDEIQRLLVAVSEHCLPPSSTSRPSAVPMRLAPSGDRERLEALLDESKPIDLPALSLLEALNKLAEEHGVPIWPDIRALTVSELLKSDSKLPAIHAGTRRQALNQLLAPPDLGWFIRQHVIVATAADRLESLDELRLYWVGDLAAQSRSAKALRATFLDAIDENWPEADVFVVDPDWLVIRASLPSHQRIEAWLAEERNPPSDDEVFR